LSGNRILGWFMIPIKIECDCGQKYAFDVEAVGGRMPQAAACPACGADGTAAAEQSLAEQLAGRALAAGVQASGSRYPVDFTELSLPHLFPLLNAVRLASLAAWIAADAGQGSLAGEYVWLGIVLAVSLEPEPAPISQLSRVACLTPLLEALEQTLSRVTLPPELLGRLQTTLDRAAEAEAVARWRLARTAVALERWRAAHDDRYPDSLGALSPNYLSAVPSGPFDGQPLRYRSTQNGYELACPGAGSDRITFTVAR
jgi:hypothetical protein